MSRGSFLLGPVGQKKSGKGYHEENSMGPYEFLKHARVECSFGFAAEVVFLQKTALSVEIENQ